MRDGERLTLLGTVSAATRGTAKTGSQYVKGVMITDDGETWKVVWWNAANAAGVGERVQLSGRVKSFRGDFELAVDETLVQRPVPDDDRARILGYLLECTEAEATAELSAPVNSTAHITLSTTACPLFTDRRLELPKDPKTTRWVQQRLSSLGETLIIGYPLIVGEETNNGGARRVVRPLFVGEASVELDQQSGRLTVGRLSDSVDPNPHALELLGMSREERDEFMVALEGSTAFDEARSSVDKVRVGIDVLLEVNPNSAPNFACIDPGVLIEMSHESGVHNSSALFVTSGSSQITRRLVEELETLLKQPSALTAGPLGRLFGEETRTAPNIPRCHPIVVPTTLRQDQAIHSAMTEVFTVVTGPPGTGKSQVLVNVIAAAVTSGQSVLFASKNNKAVDVVFERIREVSPTSNVLRAGAASRRQELASAIGDAFNRLDGSSDLAHDRGRQAAVDRLVNPVLERVRERIELEAKLRTMQSALSGLLTTLPDGVDLDVDVQTLASQLTETELALQGFTESLPFLNRTKRQRIHAERLEHATSILGSLRVLMIKTGLSMATPAEILSSVASKARRTNEPRIRILAVREQIQIVTEAARLRHEAGELAMRIDRDYAKWRMDDDLAKLTPARLEAGRALLGSRWNSALQDHPAAVAAARIVHSSLQSSAAGGSGAALAKNRLPEMLAAFPAWGVTNLSAGTNFPLVAGLFDLVVIDEASQCDLASAVPLLYRAKRALIIGDQKQLTHITQLGRVRADNLAIRWRLTDRQRVEFDFRSRSLFAAAATRVGSPLLLDMHFRSQAAIITFSNQRFYGQQLEVCTVPLPTANVKEPTVSWLDVDGDAERGRGGRSWRNVAEARAVAHEIGRMLTALQGASQSVGVVTPFRAQAEEIRDQLSRLVGNEASGVAVDTAHRFQGDERDVILFSPVLGPSMTRSAVGFANDPNLVNVALTRARHRLKVVGNRSVCLRHRDTVIADFAEYVSRLEAGPFDSPLEIQLYEILLSRGVPAVAGYLVGRYRLDLAVEPDGAKLNIECDGKAFHHDHGADSNRDKYLETQGWHVLRFSGRELSRSPDSCADEVIARLNVLRGKQS